MKLLIPFSIILTLCRGYGGLDEAEVEAGASLEFPEGCSGVPPTPRNSHMTCSLVFGCRVRCNSGFVAPNGKMSYELKCRRPGEWRDRFDEFNGKIPHCAPVCEPGCLNGGICVNPGQCDCPSGFSGNRCEREASRPCLSRPPTPRHARVQCDLSKCDVTCLPHHAFPDGSTKMEFACEDGQWAVNRRQMNDCRAVCDPPCQNGGRCLPFNQCQCPRDFKGAQCQHRT